MNSRTLSYWSPPRRYECALFGLLWLVAGSVIAAQPPAATGFAFTVIPAATGTQIVRSSLPLPTGFLGTNRAVIVRAGQVTEAAGLRVLSWHPAVDGTPPSARRAIVTFKHLFPNLKPVTFQIEPVMEAKDKPADFPVKLSTTSEGLQLAWRDGRKMDLRLIAPSLVSTAPPSVDLVETNGFFQWLQFTYPDPQWPRVIEARLDSAGEVVMVAHVQHAGTNEPYAPALGWELDTAAKQLVLHAGAPTAKPETRPLKHSFSAGNEAELVLDDVLTVYHPTAPLKRRGGIQLTQQAGEGWTYRYLRCEAKDRVPMQRMAWQRMEVVFAPKGLGRLTAALLSPHQVEVEASLWSQAYGIAAMPAKMPPVLAELIQYHRDAVVHSATVGDDFGNVTGFNHGAKAGGVFGMNRLNHGGAIFEAGWGANDPRLIETGLLWCDNFYDQSIWWGDQERGGTRYNNTAAYTPAPKKDYMWRSDSAVNFCTKGYDCFWLAWEETGDPRMREACLAQTAYAARYLHANQGECRNIGDVRDFVRLYKFTGDRQYLAEALRLFRELRTKLSSGHLFDQGGKPVADDPPFIDDDQAGLKTGYAKPYIIGYALAGLPELLAVAPDEPDLRETVGAVGDFLAETVDPAGGWRYPHPRSSAAYLSQGIEHAWQLTQAARALGPEPKWLDAIEIVLRARVLGWTHTGMILSGLDGWEVATGKVKDRKELAALYQKPADRDASRDYREGRISYGSAPPEGLVYFEEVLGYYLLHRDAGRLLAEPRPEEPLGEMLARAPKRAK